ncbi:MAG: winged helix-turn-helix domain-containing protein [Desulfovibrionaceae bacterium]|jgi:hypothetical protein|nr:winged helix-turn-helix domain-containing protein [Desulfovibrionaceae bacterium]
MKALRAERAAWVERASARARETRKELKALRAALAATGATESAAGAGATVPEIAAAANLAPDRALWLLASLRKFGEVAEVDKDGDFYRYALVGAPAPEQEQ